MNEAARIRTCLAFALLKPCLLCDGDPDLVGVYVPTAELAIELRAEPGSRLFYALCEDCFARPDIAAEVEDYFLAERSAR